MLFRNNTLYLFTIDSMSGAEKMIGAKGTDYLRFDGERITRIDPLYYLGPKAGRIISVGSSCGYVVQKRMREELMVGGS